MKSVNLLVVLLLGFISACNSNKDAPVNTPPRPDVLAQTCGLITANEICEAFLFPQGSETRREYILHTPDGTIEDSPPLFIFLHGAGGNAGDSPGPFGIRKFMTAQNYIGVFPNARANENGFRDWQEDDVEFIDFIIEQLILTKNIDPQRVFIFGFSNGGFLANLAGCKIPSKITAVFSFAGNLLEPLNNCESDGDLAIHHLHATGDEIVPYDGIDGRFLSAPDAIEEWSIYNQCDASFVISDRFELTNDENGNDSSTWTYENCIKPVQLTTIDGSGHNPSFQTLKLQKLMSDFFAAAQM
jgi:polyhydroxybutyrate depolymerase